MAESNLQDDLQRARLRLRRAAEAYRRGVVAREDGTVIGSADGVLRIRGASDAGLEEIVQVGDAGRALVLSLERDEVQAVALDEVGASARGGAVRATGEPARVPAGESLLGRVVDPLGRPLDGAPLRGGAARVPMERAAPQIHERAAVHRPLLTGVLAVDAMFPIGRGQRELVLGDEGTGKSSLALDVVLRQATGDAVCVWVAIGRRRSETWQVADALRGAGGRFVVVSAPDDASPGTRYVAPYAGTAMAEYFALRGDHAVVVHDDLTAHAAAWRELSLLLRRPPGREAYPGDVFHLHSRLLERAAQWSVERGGGTLTALPLARLEGGRLTGYIPTNLISITDGQLVLSRDLFTAGVKPAIDAGLSVSRIGGRAQPQALRDLAARLRLDYTAFLELETFARIGTRLEPATRRRIEVGRRVRALLRAPRLAPLPLHAEVVRLVLADAKDALLATPEPEVAATAVELTRAASSEAPEVVARIDRDLVLSASDRESLESIVRRVVRARHGGGDGG